MAEPGSGEGQSVEQVKETLTSAREALNKGDSSPAKEAIGLAARALSAKLEARGLPRNPDKAWTLERVKSEKDIIGEKVSYLLKPPQETQDEIGIQMAYVSLSPGGYMDDISVLPNTRNTNPYDKYATNDTKKFGISRDLETFNLISDTFGNIVDNGVVLREGGVLREQTDATEYSTNFNAMLHRLPFSSSLPESSADALAEQHRAAQTDIDARKAQLRHHPPRHTPPVTHGLPAHRETKFEPDPTDPVVRARDFGLTRDYGGKIYSIEDVGTAVGHRVVADFESGALPDPGEQSYTLTQLRVSTMGSGGTHIHPLYDLTPPPDSDLPTLSLHTSGVRIKRDAVYETNPTKTRDQERQEASSIIDAYAYLQTHGIRPADDLALGLSLSVNDRGGEEALAAFAAEFPQSASLLTAEVRNQALAKRAEVIAERERVEAERQAEIERRFAERERLQKEEEGHDFQDGLKKYVAKLATERETLQEDTLAASLRESAHRLMWTGEADEIRPGRIFSDDVLPLLERLTGGHHLTDRNRMDESPRQTLVNVEHALTQGFIGIRKDPAGKEIIEISPERIPARFEREGEMRLSSSLMLGGSRGHAISREANGAIMIKPDNDTTFTDLTVTLAPPDDELTAYLVDQNGKHTGRRITAKPILRARLTEKVAGQGEPEKTSLYRTQEGLVVICPDGTATCYPDNLSAQANLTRKPVIYLYPKKKSKIQVKLDYKGHLTNTYPQINGNTWNVVGMPDGTLQINEKQYKYLFWDGINGEIEWDWSKGFCVNSRDIDTFLEEKVEHMSLNYSEAQDFITYWAPMMKQNEWSLVSFQTERYEELAKLFINPKPDTLIRIFMVYKKCERKTNISEQKLKRIKRNGFTVVEWGGSNLDELSLMENERKTIIPHETYFETVL